MLCVLYFTCILFVFLINVVTLCGCHSEIKGYLLTYLNTVSPTVEGSICRCGVARIWCQEGNMQKLLTGFLQEATVRLCIGQSALKKLKCCKSRGATWQLQ